MTDPIKMGLRIRNQREELGLTLKDVADSIGVASSTIMRYENGTILKPKLPVIESIAKYLGVNPAWICCKTDEKKLNNNKEDINNNFILSEIEKQIIIEYRKSDEITKTMVLRALSIDESKNVKGDAEKLA
ncbi:helix-turn-helix domain-containing protein [Blautia marasmi]|uniref:helix-turn-helix domain-containing protein n=1 Tax=Blautia marasmi TaxID=1917868 RepID=UPI003513611F